ncbi:hypothetical protein C8R44DRAFT_228274 [Mycena epipterygia]|nr:hypothetical protein C8R44DRAFT_228274 [Mycena epipterygia]
MWHITLCTVFLLHVPPGLSVSYFLPFVPASTFLPSAPFTPSFLPPTISLRALQRPIRYTSSHPLLLPSFRPLLSLSLVPPSFILPSTSSISVLICTSLFRFILIHHAIDELTNLSLESSSTASPPAGLASPSPPMEPSTRPKRSLRRVTHPRAQRQPLQQSLAHSHRGTARGGSLSHDFASAESIRPRAGYTDFARRQAPMTQDELFFASNKNNGESTLRASSSSPRALLCRRRARLSESA